MRHHRILRLLAAAALLSVAAGGAQAQTYPSNKITMIVAFAPGGVADTLARMMAQGVSERLHQSVVVENRGGAGGNIAAGLVARANPDGYTVLVTTTALAINATLHQNNPFKIDDFTTVAIAASSPEALVTNPKNPAKDLAEYRRKRSKFGLRDPRAPVADAADCVPERDERQHDADYRREEGCGHRSAHTEAGRERDGHEGDSCDRRYADGGGDEYEPLAALGGADERRADEAGKRVERCQHHRAEASDGQGVLDERGSDEE